MGRCSRLTCWVANACAPRRPFTPLSRCQAKPRFGHGVSESTARHRDPGSWSADSMHLLGVSDSRSVRSVIRSCGQGASRLPQKYATAPGRSAPGHSSARGVCGIEAQVSDERQVGADRRARRGGSRATPRRAAARSGRPGSPRLRTCASHSRANSGRSSISSPATIGTVPTRTPRAPRGRSRRHVAAFVAGHRPRGRRSADTSRVQPKRSCGAVRYEAVSGNTGSPRTLASGS